MSQSKESAEPLVDAKDGHQPNEPRKETIVLLNNFTTDKHVLNFEPEAYQKFEPIQMTAEKFVTARGSCTYGTLSPREPSFSINSINRADRNLPELNAHSGSCPGDDGHPIQPRPQRPGKVPASTRHVSKKRQTLIPANHRTSSTKVLKPTTAVSPQSSQRKMVPIPSHQSLTQSANCHMPTSSTLLTARAPNAIAERIQSRSSRKELPTGSNDHLTTQAKRSVPPTVGKFIRFKNSRQVLHRSPFVKSQVPKKKVVIHHPFTPNLHSTHPINLEIQRINNQTQLIFKNKEKTPNQVTPLGQEQKVMMTEERRFKEISKYMTALYGSPHIRSDKLSFTRSMI